MQDSVTCMQVYTMSTVYGIGMMLCINIRVRDTDNKQQPKNRISTPNYLPMESTTHTPKNNFHPIQYYVTYELRKTNSVFDRVLGVNCQAFRGVGS